MGYDYGRPPARGGGCGPLFGNVALVLIGGALLGVALMMLGLWQQGGRFFDTMGSLFDQPQPTPVVDIKSVVVRQIRGASELTTTVYGMETVAEASQDRALGGFVVGSTKLLYIAFGEVRAGVDLSQIGPEDVEVISDTIAIRLPPPIILDSKIDVTRSRVYDYDRGFLNLGPEAMGLQTEAEQQALAQIVASACAAGVLDEANEKAQVALTQLLSISGYRQITIVPQPPLGCGSPAP